MRKSLLIAVTLLFLIAVIALTAALTLSFKVVKPTTDAINQKLTQKLGQLVRIPQGIAPPNRGFEGTSYFWEMETLQNEVTPVIFKFTNAYSQKDQQIIAILEMPEGADASIFNKVLSAIIIDKQALQAALDPDKANLEANQSIGYSQIALTIKPDTKQTVRITWEFNKEALPKDLENGYAKLSKYPPALLRVLFNIPGLFFTLLSG